MSDTKYCKKHKDTRIIELNDGERFCIQCEEDKINELIKANSNPKRYMQSMTLLGLIVLIVFESVFLIHLMFF
jgi:hypothetical protein